MFKYLLIPLLIILCPASSYSSDIQSGGPAAPDRPYTYTGSAETYIWPNAAWISCGISTRGIAAKEALAENDKIIARCRPVMRKKQFDNYDLTVYQPSVNRGKSGLSLGSEEYFVITRIILLKFKEPVNDDTIDAFIKDSMEIIDLLSQSGINVWGRSFKRLSSLSTEGIIWYGFRDTEEIRNKLKKAAFEDIERQINSDPDRAFFKTRKLIDDAIRIRPDYNESGYLDPEDAFIDESIGSAFYKPVRIRAALRANYLFE